MIDQIISMMIAERDRINRVIDILQGTAKRRGRPPKLPVVVVEPVAAAVEPEPVAESTTPKRGWTAAQRRTQSRRVRAYWAARRRAA